MTRAADLRFKQGLSYQSRNQHRLAIKEYEAALEIDPDHLPAMANLGILLMIDGDNNRAVELLGQVAELEPNCPDNHFNFSKALLHNGRIYDALEALLKAEALSPKDIDILKSIAHCHTSLGQHEQALVKLQELAALSPDDLEIMISLGKCLMALGRQSCSKDAFERAREIDPYSYQSHLGLGAVLRAMGQFEKSVHHYKEAYALSAGRIEAYLGAASSLRDMGKNDLAAQEVTLALSYAPNDSSALELLREIRSPKEFGFVGDERMEKEHKDRIETLKTPEYVERRIRKLFTLENWDGAIEELNKIIAIAPSKIARLRLAQAYMKKDQHRQGIEALQDILKDEPEDVEVGCELINIALMTGNYEMAGTQLKLMEEKGDEEPKLLMLAARYYSETGDKEKTRDRLEKLIGIQPDKTDAYLELSQLAYKDGRIEDALRLWETAYRYDAKRHEILFLISSAQFRLGRYNHALKTMKSYIETFPDDIAARGFLAEILLKLKKIRQAKNEWHTMKEQSPATPQDSVAKAKAALFLGHTALAKEQLSITATAHPGLASAHFYLGVTDLISNAISDASAKWVRAWKMNAAQTEGALRFLAEYFNSKKMHLVLDELVRIGGPVELIQLIRELI